VGPFFRLCVVSDLDLTENRLFLRVHNRFRLFDLTPVARDLLIEHMSYGVLVLDDQGDIIDVNPAARNLFVLEKELVGLGIDEVSTEIANWLEGGVSEV
jgi:PAS domain-containing protein